MLNDGMAFLRLSYKMTVASILGCHVVEKPLEQETEPDLQPIVNKELGATKIYVNDLGSSSLCPSEEPSDETTVLLTS